MKIMKIYLLLAAVSVAACATVDVDKRVRNAGRGRPEPPVMIAPLETDPIVLERERPVFIPDSPAQPQRPSGTQAVLDSNSDGIVKPSEYSHASMIYDYDRDWVYEVYTQPLRATDICLEPEERVVEPPYIADSERWMLGAGVSFASGLSIQHVYVKPTTPGLEASLIINTDRRVYHIILRSYKTVHMPIVRWRYPFNSMPNNYLPLPKAEEKDERAPGVDPRYLSFNYRVTYGWFRKPVWMPELVYDDGQKTYITFPDLVLQRELPAIFENRRDVVNYRVAGKLIIIDKLIEQITVKIERKEISITKKRG